ncbi:Remorin 4.1, partial [Mucuna pruriens]
MLNAHGPEQEQEEEEVTEIREIHALTPPQAPAPRGRAWETLHTHRPSSLSVASTEGENFTTMSREFNALVLAGSNIDHDNISPTNEVHNNNNNNNLGRIREEELMEETNPLAIVPDNHPLNRVPSRQEHVSVQRVKKEEVDAKISAWQNAKIAKINNRFKREDAVINGWESEQVQKATSWMKKVERKLEEKRARAMEKMQNDIAKAHRKAEERKASAEGKRGTKVARVLEIASLMKAVGRPPTKKSFF